MKTSWEVSVGYILGSFILVYIKDAATEKVQLSVSIREEGGPHSEINPGRGYEAVRSLAKRKASTNSSESGPCSVCGKGTQGHRPKILVVNGDDVFYPDEYPWMVSLLDSKNQKICGGAIISERFIVTAAHCFLKADHFMRELDEPCTSEHGRKKKVRCCDDGGRFGHPEPCFLEPEELTVAFLTRSPDVVTDGKAVEEIILPEGFNVYEGMEEDIALVRLKEPIPCDQYAQPICLPTQDMKVEVGSQYSITGWGFTDAQTQEMTDTLQEARIVAVEPEKCKMIDPQARDREDYSYCLMGVDNESPCAGDSGGAMFTHAQKRFFAMGVTSIHTSQVCETSMPFMYTSIPKYMDWIKEKTGLGPPDDL